MSSFNRYLKQLQQLDPTKTLLTTSRSIVLLSGSSHYEHATLSKEQKKFLLAFTSYGFHLVESNFPYNQEFEHHSNSMPNLFTASLSNIRYYAHTLFHPAFKNELYRHLLPLFALEEVIIITQSSGLNMLTQVIERTRLNRQMQIFSLGPVSRKQIGHEDLTVCIIKGRQDYYSRLLDRHPSDETVPCGHHDYLNCSQVKEIVHAYIQKNQN